jgi:hypothetical protein
LLTAYGELGLSGVSSSSGSAQSAESPYSSALPITSTRGRSRRRRSDSSRCSVPCRLSVQVGAQGTFRIQPRLVDAGLGRQVDDAVGVDHVEHRVHRRRVLDLRLDLDDRTGQRHPVDAAPHQTVDRDPRPCLQQVGDQVGSHETGGAGDEQRALVHAASGIRTGPGARWRPGPCCCRSSRCWRARPKTGTGAPCGCCSRTGSAPA